MRIKVFGYNLSVKLSKARKKSKILTTEDISDFPANPKLNLGPGPNWTKPDETWYDVDIDPDFGDIIVDFQKFERFPFPDNTVECVYGSHVFEHMSIFKTPLVFKEIFRILKPGGIFRGITPDAEKSINEYLKGNKKFELFRRRSERAKAHYGKEYTLFECLREDFLSPSGQQDLLGENSLAHQNAWDYETLHSDLSKAGFNPSKITRMDFKKSHTSLFDFEGTFISEANQDYRSIYVEAIK